MKAQQLAQLLLDAAVVFDNPDVECFNVAGDLDYVAGTYSEYQHRTGAFRLVITPSVEDAQDLPLKPNSRPAAEE